MRRKRGYKEAVAPAQAGAQFASGTWIPAFAGMTTTG